jgi:VanZ family protein
VDARALTLWRDRMMLLCESLLPSGDYLLLKYRSSRQWLLTLRGTVFTTRRNGSAVPRRRDRDRGLPRFLRPRIPGPPPESSEPRPEVLETALVPAWLRVWWPALLWAAVVFGASTDSLSSQNTSSFVEPMLRWLHPAITQGQLDVIHFAIRKLAHIAEYSVLYVLAYRGVANRRARWRWSWGLGAWVLVAAFSVLDEIHQSFVPSRTASPWDIALDSTGAAVGMLGVFILLRCFREVARDNIIA